MSARRIAMFMVFNVTFNNNSVISWRRTVSVLVEINEQPTFINIFT